MSNTLTGCTIQVNPKRFKQGVMEAFAAIGIFLSIVTFAHCGPGCKQPEVPTAEVNYTLDLLRCVEKSKTREESRKCRDDVSRDAGLCHILNGDEQCP